jgi:hypothetical protein
MQAAEPTAPGVDVTYTIAAADRSAALGRLQEKGAVLEDSAATFAEAARRLREGR